MTELVSWWGCDSFQQEVVVVSFSFGVPKRENRSVSPMVHQTSLWVTSAEEQGSVRSNTSLERVSL